MLSAFGQLGTPVSNAAIRLEISSSERDLSTVAVAIDPMVGTRI
jgi:hypothetical protein